MDPHSFANIHEIEITHIDLNLNVSFSSKALSGEAIFQCRVIAATDTATLDTKELEIHGVEVDGTPTTFHLNPSEGAFGSALVIDVPTTKTTTTDATFQIKVQYSTTPSSSGIQWLDPPQTADKIYPYMFTQAQAIHARSILPCQDAPSAKFTYTATVRVPSWATCLMSAVQVVDGGDGDGEDNNVDNTTDNIFQWHQKVPIPSYLVAFVIGSLESREVGPRTKVWSEVSVVDQAAYEFHQTEEFIQHAEAIMDQEYVWGRYDLVCLPPSFPYGGTENPCLTFVTPTLLTAQTKTLEDGKVEFQAGRELVSVIAHEIAHSWTGNLITNHTWEHFWLNEGWTVWLERKIMARVHSPEYFDFDAITGWNALKDSVNMFGSDHQFTCLKPCLDHVDPDDFYSSVPYEKGFNFLYYLSRTIGEGPFETFAQAYVQEFKYKTVTTEQFCEFFRKYCAARSLDISRVDFDAWVNQPGMPTVTPDFDDSLSSSSINLAQSWYEINRMNMNDENSDNNNEGNSAAAILEKIQNLPDVSTWTSAQMVVMLEKLLGMLAEAKESFAILTLEQMGQQYEFNMSRNAEVRFCWQTLCIRSEGEFCLPCVETFIKEQGRMKFIRPLYRELYRSKFGKTKAMKWFAEWRSNYHPIAQKMVAKDLELSD